MQYIITNSIIYQLYHLPCYRVILWPLFVFMFDSFNTSVRQLQLLYFTDTKKSKRCNINTTFGLITHICVYILYVYVYICMYVIVQGLQKTQNNTFGICLGDIH